MKMAHQDKENYTVILNSKNRIAGVLSSTDNANYLFDWGAIPEGQYKMTYSLCKQLYLTPLDALLAAKPAWGIYKAENFDVTNQLLIDSSPNGRDATCVGCSLSNISGFGASVGIPTVTGFGTSTILFSAGSIPPVFTMFALTRYLDVAGGRRVLSGTGENGPVGNFILGHFYDYPRVYNHSNFLTNVLDVQPKNNFCNIGFSSASTAPDNILFNGVGIGTGNRSGLVTGRLCVNLFLPFGTTPFETCNFGLSQVIIWDRELTTAEMKIVSTSFTNYLETGVI